MAEAALEGFAEWSAMPAAPRAAALRCVADLIEARNDDIAVAQANSTRYRLSAIVCTGCAARAGRIGRAVRAGIVWNNTFLVRDLAAPFGGFGLSGIGREGGDHALDFHSDLKTLIVADNTTA